MSIGGDALSEIVLRLGFALALGATVGLERGYHGRPAGFRTHALVCLASSALMLVPMFPAFWADVTRPAMQASLDPTRMAQGIMTGIGFLGAGVIMKEGLTVRGLTTAASIWTTAGIGVLVGIGWYLPAGLTTVLALGALGAFRWIERRVRHESFGLLLVRFGESGAVNEPELVSKVSKHGFTVSDVSHWFQRAQGGIEYQMTLCSLDPSAIQRLSDALRADESVAEFRFTPTAN